MKRHVLELIKFLFKIKNLKYYIGNILIVIIPILLILWPNLISFITYNLITTGVFILALIICVIFSLHMSQDLMSKIENVRELEHKISNLTAFLETTPERVIKSIFNYLEFGYEERITVYRYADSHFIPIGRYAKNIEYKKGGRDKYPYNEGFIGIAWQTGELIIENLPDPNKQFKGYIKQVQSKCTIDEKTVEEMRMKSRSYYCLNLENLSRDAIAVIVFESTNSELPKRTSEIKHLLNSSFGLLIVEIINMNLPGRRD